MGPDLTDRRWGITKGVLFLVLAIFAGLIHLLADLPTWQEATLLLICIWSACRFYFFAFHGLHAYVGVPSPRLVDLIRQLMRR